MTPQALKASILQLAIQGKLVPQRPEEGTAEELYQQIQAEKQRLIANGTIKREKALPPIKEDEIPFDIPETWKWVRLGELFSLINGDRGKNYPAKSTLHKEGIPFISAINISDRSISPDGLLCVSPEQFANLRSGHLKKGDLVICIRGSLGKFCIYPYEQGAIASSLVILRQIWSGSQNFIAAYLDSFFFREEIEKSQNGTAQPNLSAKDLAHFLVPLPPLEEQKRIVAKIEEMLPLIDRYGEAYTKLETFNKRFPDDLRKSILQEAIQGKLVPQLPEEGTAEELYQQIQAEKQRLIAAGAIKKEKPLPPIEEKGLPFDIPETWKWVRLDDLVCKNIKRGKSPVYTEESSIAVFSQKCNSKNNGIMLSLARHLDESKLSAYSETDFLSPDDIIINSTGEGTLGRVGIFTSSDNPLGLRIVPDSHVTIIRSTTRVHPPYLYYCLKSQQSVLEKAGEGSTKQTELRPQFLRELLIPLPPLAEQKRIVAKIEQLLTLCKSMK